MRHFPIAAVLTSAATATALAQQGAPPGPAIYDPQQLPVIKGSVAQYSLTPRGDVDGVILQDGTQVHLPPHLGAQIVQAIKTGDSVTIRGLKTQALPLVQALSVTDDASGQSVVDSGPPATPPQPVAMGFEWLQVQGTVREPLYGPRGDTNGALLEDGTQVHLPPDQAWSLGAHLQAGRMLVAQGYGVAGAYGKSLDAQRIGDSATQLVEVGPPGRPGGPGLTPPPPGGGTGMPPPPAPRVP
ncbi:MAG TPA: hypothetical protein VK281_12170 [Xanthobacteraceae bacterium]|nr:hypothetical protein [Xanthobacteraceae bacterium]